MLVREYEVWLEYNQTKILNNFYLTSFRFEAFSSSVCFDLNCGGQCGGVYSSVSQLQWENHSGGFKKMPQDCCKILEQEFCCALCVKKGF